MKENNYQPVDFEQKWRSWWEDQKVYKTGTKDIDRVYTLVMFPYPSGAGLHVGHARVYTGTDVLARYFRMQGKQVLHPMGWDAFGLPAENAAIKQKKNPMDLVPANIATFKRQMQSLGLSYDWDREFATTDLSYYQWTQWLFIQFFKMGLLYKKETPIYYCPFCKTGLAQEEVLNDGTHERCGNKVEQRSLPQWIFRITQYADRLLSDLQGLDWPKGILEQQKNWIGKKEGITITHRVEGLTLMLDSFTVYPAWVYADTFIVIAPDHPSIKLLVEGTPYEQEVEKFVKKCQSMTPEDRAKEEIEGAFTGRYAIDPLTQERMPIWVANFAMMDFGTGVIRCSAHDPRDREFARKYELPLKEVVERHGEEPVEADEEQGVLKDSGPFTNKRVDEVKQEMVEWFVDQGFAQKHTTYHLRDWIFSRQRYWGEPIPMVFCARCAKNKITNYKLQITNLKAEDQIGSKIKQKISKWNKEIEEQVYGWFPVKEENLPIELPKIASYELTDTGESPLSQVTEWLNTTCPNCLGPAKRETDTMPNWAGSCWYYLYFGRNTGNHNNQAPNSKQIQSSKTQNSKENGLTDSFFENSKLFDIWNLKFGISSKKWLPVDWYIGGAEHAVLHLLYARFWSKAMYDLGLIDYLEPFLRLRNVGMVIAKDSRKMSKSFGNVITPDDVAEYGMDALRVYEMFMAPFSQEVVWSDTAMQGSHRFIKRIWQIYTNSANITNKPNQEDDPLAIELQRLILKISVDITNVKFNTAIAEMMKFINLWEEKLEIRNKKLGVVNAKAFLKLLAPFAPYITEEIWHTIFKESGSIHLSAWPVTDEKLIVRTTISIPVQVDGKVRDIITVGVDNDQDAIVAQALASEKVKKWVASKPYEVIYKEGKILNLVTS